MTLRITWPYASYVSVHLISSISAAASYTSIVSRGISQYLLGSPCHQVVIVGRRFASSYEYRISSKKNVSTFPSGHLGRYKPKTPNLHINFRFGFVNKNMSGFVAVRNMANKPPLSCVAFKFFVLTWLLYD